MEQQQYKYFAFISYNSRDTEWGKRVQRKLENYRMPSTLCSEHGWKRKPIKPVFFAPTDIQPGGLTEELQERLRASRNLIVICSPNSAQSEWVGKEIEFFHSLGRTKQIHFFIVDGKPHSGNPDTECFNPVVDRLGLPEILGANIHEQTQTYPFTNIPWPRMNRERAYVQLVSKLLGVEFDAIWQRHKRQLIQQCVTWVVGIMAVLTALIAVWVSNQPLDVNVRLVEVSAHNANLPPLKDAVVTMTLDNEIKTDTAKTMDSRLLFTNIPHKYLGKNVNIKITCPPYYYDVDTTITLAKDMTVDLHRDPSTCGDVFFQMWDAVRECYVPDIKVEIEGHKHVSDKDGYVRCFIPLAEQKTQYHINASVPLEHDTISVPCWEGNAVIVRNR